MVSANCVKIAYYCTLTLFLSISARCDHPRFVFYCCIGTSLLAFAIFLLKYEECTLVQLQKTDLLILSPAYILNAIFMLYAETEHRNKKTISSKTEYIINLIDLIDFWLL